MTKSQIKLLLPTTFLIALIGGCSLFLYKACEIFPPLRSRQELISNYEKNKKKITEVKDYFESIVSPEAVVVVEFKKRELAIFHVSLNGISENNWNIPVDSPKTDSLLIELGWTKNELHTLKSKLDQADCISVSSRKPVTIGWQRSGTGIYYYKIFDGNLTTQMIEEYNDSCTYLFYKDNVVLEYGSGAIGPICFPGLK